MSGPLFFLRGVHRDQGGRTVLDVPELAIPAGGVTGISGPNGGGKTTLLRLLAFLDHPDRGEVLFDGRPTVGREVELRREVTLLNQSPYLLKRSVAANVGYGPRLRGVSDVAERVAEALSMVGLDPGAFSGRKWFELSGGEAQRVALAARLVLRPRALLLDEPTASLDAQSAVLVRRAALTARENWGATLVVVSHDLAWLGDVADRMLGVREGRVFEEEKGSCRGGAAGQAG